MYQQPLRRAVADRAGDERGAPRERILHADERVVGIVCVGRAPAPGVGLGKDE